LFIKPAQVKGRYKMSNLDNFFLLASWNTTVITTRLNKKAWLRYSKCQAFSVPFRLTLPLPLAGGKEGVLWINASALIKENGVTHH
jgi:hypothetical protein